MKQIFLRSIIGHMALSCRRKFNILYAALYKIETVGTVANDQLASLLISKICLSNKVFVDVGAHIGSVFSQVHRNDKSIHIVAIEAIPEKASKLKSNFPYAEIHQCAAGEKEGNANFFININQSGYSTLAEQYKNQNNYKTISTPLKKIDDIILKFNVDTIKIDVEGAELGVIRGGKKIIEKCRPIIMFESGTIEDNSLGYTKEELWRQLHELEYIAIIPNRLAHNDNGLSLEGFVESHLYPRRTTNYFAVPKERRVEIRDRARHITGLN